jgi:FMN phosphatase YigB (HAD superfamily)
VPYPFKAAVFDLGNTLIHFTGAWPEVMARADAALLEHLLAAGLGFSESRFLPDFRARLADLPALLDRLSNRRQMFE